jgi:hypothetical protein
LQRGDRGRHGVFQTHARTKGLCAELLETIAKGLGGDSADGHFAGVVLAEVGDETIAQIVDGDGFQRDVPRAVIRPPASAPGGRAMGTTNAVPS